ncbi:hypothetical protein [Marinilabilia salmonicolor]|uniref:hypothetical protein n=1 Tax=Marinilabilia salmonicolor TaxID=989 RepID=UPI001F3C4441|nr:hypothetical protein [Marinilabilia salmonicolor]
MLCCHGRIGRQPAEGLEHEHSICQSAVFTPCDFAFPTNGIKTEATPNTEMILVADVDLDLLSELHAYGSVRNLRDRRTDVFDLRLKSGLIE